ncbi:MAG: Holliday junction branch migration protein RuvA [Bacteroidales bacterium]|nr:Holliday junction branch migration protein RuvA [Bacteroidales bacterium]MBQ1913097.1 Holliday junction branch migration protein RuvA [Bacteroidales bacterium]
MIDYIKGQIVELTPTELVLENNGIGYSILLSLQSFEAFQGKSQVTAYIHHYLREDEELYFGFATKDERELFRLLIGVSGIGVASARMMLSSLTAEEIRQAILAEDVHRIKSVKGIGLKSAQRLILELKDKIGKGEGAAAGTLPLMAPNNALIDEATTALVMLGFSKANVTKVLPTLLKENPTAKVEDLIKAALKRL